MIIRCRGVWYRVNLWKLIRDPERKEIVNYILNEWKKSFSNYWFGFIRVYEQTISGSDEDTGQCWTKLYYVNLTVGRKGKAYAINNLFKEDIKNIIKQCKICNTKYFKLTVSSYGCGYQQYYFNRHQQEQLIHILNPYLEHKDWFLEK